MLRSLRAPLVEVNCCVYGLAGGVGVAGVAVRAGCGVTCWLGVGFRGGAIGA